MIVGEDAAVEGSILQVPGTDGAGAHSDLDDAAIHAVSPFGRAVRRFVRRPLGMVALGYLVLMILLAIFGHWVMPDYPNAQSFLPFQGPSTAHWLGTDDLGRDLASRLIAGAAVSVRAGYETVAMALIIAVPIGLFAGYVGGRVDYVLLRIMDALASFPALILALVIAAVLGPGLGNAMIAIAIVIIPGFVRLTRASTLAVSQETFVEASRSIGTPTWTILRKRILPSVLSPLIIAVTVMLGVAIIAEASLSFLGLGTQSPNASWGNMMQEGYNYLFSNPYLIIPPGVAVAFTVLSFNIVGDTLRDALGLAEMSRRGTSKRGRPGTKPRRHSRGGRLGMTLVAPQLRSKLSQNGRKGAHDIPLVRSTAGGGDPSHLPLLSVRDLQVEFTTDTGPVIVVDGVSFDVDRGEVVGLVGESGSGKTVTSLSIMRLLRSPPACITKGQISFKGRDLLQLPLKELADLRGDSIAMVFQDPMTSLNPAFTVGNQLTEAVRFHRGVSRDQARRRAKELLDVVGIPDAENRLMEYPHRLSGGMRQRALIAMALANEPELLIADEPTTALDVTVQAQILELLRSLQKDLGMAMIFVTHDLGAIAEIADRVIVMYAGELVEQSPVHSLFNSPKHPYTQKLLSAIPQSTAKGERLAFIPGIVPIPGHWAVGCRFSNRCDYATDECRAEPVTMTSIGLQCQVRCIRHAEIDARGVE